MVSFREEDLSGYTQLKKCYPDYKINVEKGRIIKADSQRILGHQSTSGNLLTRLWNKKTKSYDNVYIHKLIWEACNGKYDDKKYRIEHKNKDYFNNSINNLELVLKGYQKKTNKIIIITNKVTNEKQEYKSINNCSKLTGISNNTIKNHIMNNKPIKDKNGNTYKIRLKQITYP